MKFNMFDRVRIKSHDGTIGTIASVPTPGAKKRYYIVLAGDATPENGRPGFLLPEDDLELFEEKDTAPLPRQG